MTGRSHTEGDNIIQSPEVSSSSDVLNSRLFEFNNVLLNFPRARRSYRNITIPRNPPEYPFLHADLNNDMAIPPIPPRRIPIDNGICKCMFYTKKKS